MLLSLGRRVTVIDRQPPGMERGSKGFRYLRGDCGDVSVLEEGLRDVDEVIDLAYSTVPKTSFDDPVQDILNNLPSSVTLLDRASFHAVRKMVVVSSGGTVYGVAQHLPIPEDHPTNPISPYGITKLAVEKYALMYHHLRGLPVAIVRPGNAYGERQMPSTGQGFIATAIGSILADRVVPLFGEHGTVRDYIHVGDVAQGIIAVLDQGQPGSCYNIGSGVGKSNSDVLDCLRSLAAPWGLSVRIELQRARGFDVPANVLDTSKLRAETTWKAMIPFEQGLERTWRWFMDAYRSNG